MNIYGIRILDKTKSHKDPSIKFLDVSLSDILEGITEGSSYDWMLTFLDGSPAKGYGPFLIEYQHKIKNSEKGVFVKWEDLYDLNNKFFQIYEMTLLGSRNSSILKRYTSEKEMYEKCEMVIELIDCSFWEVHAHEKALILNLQKKFNQTELL